MGVCLEHKSDNMYILVVREKKEEKNKSDDAIAAMQYNWFLFQG